MTQIHAWGLALLLVLGFSTTSNGAEPSPTFDVIGEIQSIDLARMQMQLGGKVYDVSKLNAVYDGRALPEKEGIKALREGDYIGVTSGDAGDSIVREIWILPN